MPRFLRTILPVAILAALLTASPLYAAIGYVNQASNYGTSTTLAINAPAGGTNSVTLLIASVTVYYSSSQPTITNPSNWNTIGSDAVAGTYLVRRTAWHIWATGETSYTWTFNNASYNSGGIMSFNGTDTANPIDVSNTGTGTSGTTVTDTAITTTDQSEMLVFFPGSYYSTGRSQSAESVTGNSMAEVYDINGSSALSRCGNAGAYYLWSGKGSTGSATSTISSSITSWSGCLVAVRSAPNYSASLAQTSGYSGSTVATVLASPSLSQTSNFSGSSSVPLIKLVTSSGSPPYTTSFPATENPISEGGKYLGGLADGLDWTNVRTLANTKAYGTQTGTNGTDDSIAILKDRAYANTQYAKGTLFIAGSDTQDEEVEIHVQGNIAAHNVDTYELEYVVKPTSAGNQIKVDKWTGAKGSYTMEASGFWGTGAYNFLNGDRIKATIVNGVITAYLNNVQGLQWTDPSPYTGGAPGMGMFLGASGGNDANFGLSDFEGGDQVENINGTYWGGSATSGAISTPINVTAGNTLIIVCGSYQHVPAVADLSKTSGTATIGTPVRDKTVGGTSGTIGLSIFHIPITGSGSLTITFNPGVNYCEFAIIEFSGIASVGVTDSNTGSGTAQTTNSMANTSGSLIVYIASELSTADKLRAYSDTLLAGSNDSQVTTFGAQYKVTSTTPNTLTTTWGESVSWWTCAVEYLAATGSVYSASTTLGQTTGFGGAPAATFSPTATLLQTSQISSGANLAMPSAVAMSTVSAFSGAGGNLFALSLSLANSSGIAGGIGTTISMLQSLSQSSGYSGGTAATLNASSSLPQASGYAGGYNGTMGSAVILSQSSGFSGAGGNLFAASVNFLNASTVTGGVTETVVAAQSLAQSSGYSGGVAATLNASSSLPQASGYAGGYNGTMGSAVILSQSSGFSGAGGNLFAALLTLSNSSQINVSAAYNANPSAVLSQTSGLSETASLRMNPSGALSAVSLFKGGFGNFYWATATLSNVAKFLGRMWLPWAVLKIPAESREVPLSSEQRDLLLSAESREVPPYPEQRNLILVPESRVVIGEP